ncbi:hypothetical protein CgunFtcFv8_022453 [Champsocephalus gunnari]|uniref:Uncharacterized protein n=1 Tax=Champsocephalus gunnari TaxID=52237 RepID=A0AAN8HT64_CHAGU|nr:hypothetical protein CgunFtcFv8_022453 [Champsocephalus gunnari]
MRGGGGLSQCHRSCSYDIYSKSPTLPLPTVVPPLSSLRADRDGFPTRVLSAAALDDTDPGQAGPEWQEVLAFNLTHIQQPQLDVLGENQVGCYKLVWHFHMELLAGYSNGTIDNVISV